MTVREIVLNWLKENGYDEIDIQKNQIKKEEGMRTFEEMINNAIEEKEYKAKAEKLEKMLTEFGFKKDVLISDDEIMKFELPDNVFDISLKVAITLAGYVETSGGSKYYYNRYYLDEYSPEEIFAKIYRKVEKKIQEIGDKYENNK